MIASPEEAAFELGLLAMLLAAVGIYGVVAYSTRQRAREIGIRMALGAEKGGIYRLVLDQGFRLTLAGLVVGTALAVAFTRLLTGLRGTLYPQPSDHHVFFRERRWASSAR